MKAPEKIYLYPYSTDGIYEVETKPLDGTIEYTRTDAFINKACEYMRNHIDQQLTIYHNESWKKRDEFILDFKKYMKGE